MNRITHWLVADHGIRPAGPPDRCFYCDRKMGQEHKDGCVIRKRTVVVRYQIDLVVSIPEDCTADMINFRYNESTWCGDNLVDDIAAAAQRMEDGPAGCLCPVVHAQYLREATEEDEALQRLRANELPS